MGRLATPPNIFQKADILGWQPSQRRCLETGSFSTTTDAFQLPRRDRSHFEKLGITRPDLLALRQYRSGIGLEQFQRRQRRATWLFLDLRMERTMRIIVDQQLLALDAEEETLEQPRGVRIRRAAEDAGRNNDER